MGVIAWLVLGALLANQPHKPPTTNQAITPIFTTFYL